MHTGKTLLVIMFLLSTSVFASLEFGTSTEPEITTNSDSYINITENEYHQVRSDLWEDKIVWEDYRNDPIGGLGSPYYRNPDIYMHDLTTGDTIRLTQDTSAQIKPSIWENYVTWEDYRHGNPEIYYMDLNTMTEYRVTENTADQISPRIHGGRIVWVDKRDNWFGDIYMYDIEEDETHIISDERHRKDNPDIYGDIIVWSDYRNYWAGLYPTQASDIYMYDLNSNEEIPIVEEAFHQRRPSIYEDTAAWIEYDGETNNIYMKTIGQDKILVTAESSAEEDPKIYGGRIVFSERFYDEQGNHPHDAIWVYDITENTKTRIAKVDVGETEGTVARFPAIYQDQIIWEERHLSSDENLTFQYDIFYTDIGKEAPQILQTSIYSDTDEGNGAADMILREGANFTVTAEVIDKDGDLSEVILEYNQEVIIMENTVGDIYSTTIYYDQNMSAGTIDLVIRATDEEGLTDIYDELTITYIERPPEINFIGVGTSPQNLSQETNFTLEEGNTLFFEADVTDPDEDLHRVYINLEGFNLTDERFGMTETEPGRFVFELEYSERMTEGEKIAWVTAEDARGNTAESQELVIYAEFPVIEDENGDPMCNWRFLLLLCILIIVILSIIYIYRKRKDTQEDVSEEETEEDTEEETPPISDIDMGVCPTCIEVIPTDSTECPHCGEELDTSE